jgi:hypothetical protein
MAVGAGALAGAVAQLAQRGRLPRAAGIASIVAGCIFFATALLFVPVPDLFASPLGPATLVVTAALVLGGAWVMVPRSGSR